MKNSVTEHEVIEAIRTHGAMAVEQLASTVETFKHFVFPVIGSLVKQGYIQKKESGNGAPLFELGPKTFEFAEIQQQPIPATPKAAEPQEVAKPAVALVDATKSSNASTPDKEADIQRIRPARLSVVKPALSAVAQTPANAIIPPSELVLLAYLRLCAQRMSAIQEVFGDCDELLAGLAEKNLVESAYIIDQYVFTLNHAEAFKLYPQLSSENDAKAIFDKAGEKPEIPAKPEVTAQALPTIQSLTPPEAKAAIEPITTLEAPPAVTEPAAFAVETSIEPAILDEEFEENRTVIRDEFAQHEEPLLSGDAVSEIAKLVQRLVQSELKKEREKLGDGIDVEAISSKIRKAAVSLRDAAKALEETLSILLK